MTLVPLLPPPAPFALTTDELRAVARCVGAPLSSLLLEDEDEGDAPVADAVALRSLAARGLVLITGDPADGGEVGLPAAVRRLLEPVLSPEALVEVEIDRPAHPFVDRHVVAASGGRTLVLSEADEADVWRVLEGPGQPAATLAALVGLRGSPVDGGAGSGLRLAVPAPAHEAADNALEEGGDPVAVLVAAGAERATAAAWVAAVGGRSSTVELRAARLLPDDVVEAAELRILSAGPLGTWMLDLEDPDDAAADGDEGREAMATSVITDIGEAAAAAAVAALLPGRPVRAG